MTQLYGLVAAPGNLTGMRDQTIEAFLGELAARVPAPGGGATAALHAAQAAALLAMVARYSDGPRYDADHTVAAFAARLQDTVDLDSVRDDLASVVHQTLEPAHVSLWISQRD